MDALVLVLAMMALDQFFMIDVEEIGGKGNVTHGTFGSRSHSTEVVIASVKSLGENLNLQSWMIILLCALSTMTTLVAGMSRSILPVESSH